MTTFDASRYLPDDWIQAITDRRVSDPAAVRRAAQIRRRRDVMAPKGRLVILAADHPARNVNRVGDDPLRMGDRREYLARIVRVLEHPEVDGLMATTDIIDDLFLLNDLLVKAGGPDLLADRVLIGSMNRGGLSGASWELNDPYTCYSVESILDQRLDGGKQLFRIALDEPDSLRTMEMTVAEMTKLARQGLPSFLEPLPVAKTADGRWGVVKTAEALIPVVGIAQGMGETSAYTWLKLPVSADFGRVAAATTMPILLLGGEPTGNVEPLLRELADCLSAGQNVRGLLIGRNILFPGAYDPYAAGAAACALVHGTGMEQSLERLGAPAPAADLFTRVKPC